ncbi:hypothetical protein [Leifsonia aquatica]|uniref:hypothetical protein n=1 Tax=Leifsonia aquatica TaxID=144185 RepID=UPI003830409D
MDLLAALFRTRAATYHHLSQSGRAAANDMIEMGWVERRSSLLTEAEADYFNYMLNRAGFSDGPNLRNKCQHGSQNGSDDSEHFNAYITALRLMIALVIKVNDEFIIASAVQSETGG